MTTRAMGPAAGWHWLKQGINLGRHNPKAIFGAVALVALVALIPSVIQLVLTQGLKLTPETVLSVVGLTTLLSIVVYPLLIGGVLRVIDASENGRPTHAAAVFDTFKPGHDAGRLIGFGVLLTVLYIAAFVAVIGLFGKDFFGWYLQVISTAMQAQAPSPAVLPAMPEGLGLVMAFGVLVGLFFGGVYTIGFGQVALGGRGIGEALVDGVKGTMKNVLPIVVAAIIVIIGFIAIALVFALVGMLVAVIGSLLHPTVGLILLAPLYIGFLLVLYVVMFGAMYFMWRDVAGQDAAVPHNQVEV
ncbi:MAG: hypothetical protein LH470_08885 [Lysobacter sp.]|nr:hypothetical protein [Lysobacter sp.]